MPRYDKRSPDEIKKIDSFIAEHYPLNGSKWCAEKLNLNMKYVGLRASLKGIKMNNGREKKSSERRTEIDKFIKAYYPKNGAQYCANKLGETAPYIRNRCTQLGLVMDRSGINPLIEENGKLKETIKKLRKDIMKLMVENKKLKRK